MKTKLSIGEVEVRELLAYENREIQAAVTIVSKEQDLMAKAAGLTRIYHERVARQTGLPFEKAKNLTNEDLAKIDETLKAMKPSPEELEDLPQQPATR